MDPSIPNGFLYEYAQAQMAREIFPEHPLKYMPPTKHMSGDIFKGLVMDNMFNFVSKATGQGIHLLGMLTEEIHTPFMMDRYIAVDTAKYVMNNMADFGNEIEFRQDGIIVKRAHEVLDQALDFLREVERLGLMDSIEQGLFADIKRSKDGGKGLGGLVEKADDYWNPVERQLKSALSVR
ncbi:MAG: lysine 5,6-aminomutase subunit alpha, partial [Spirochaetaceae bacterium]|nr:lysine 5,6-aminomutase subunit alpha [Spirochaetaceae bacterium]